MKPSEFTHAQPIGTLLGCVLNPKTLRPSLVYVSRTGLPRARPDVVITDPSGNLVGRGSYGEFEESANEQWLTHPDPLEAVLASELTGFPRAARVGVREQYQGQGYATVVYTALVLGAWAATQVLPGTAPSTNIAGAGISSNANRSDEADVWWDRAKELGIAYEEQVGEDPEEEEYSVTLPLRDNWKLRDVIEHALQDDEIYSVVRLEDITVEGTHTPGGTESGTADVFELRARPRATGARPLILFGSAAPAYELPVREWAPLGDVMSPGVRHVPSLGEGNILRMQAQTINTELAPLLNLSETNVYIQNAIREAYETAGQGRLFEHIREETIGARYDVSRGYLENRSVPKSNREAYEQLNLAAYAELPG
jgi:hypothetical protein